MLFNPMLNFLNAPADLARLIIFHLFQKKSYMKDLILMIQPILICYKKSCAKNLLPNQQQIRNNKIDLASIALHGITTMSSQINEKLPQRVSVLFTADPFYHHHKGILRNHSLNSLHHFHHCLIFHARPVAGICHCYLVLELLAPSLSLFL